MQHDDRPHLARAAIIAAALMPGKMRPHRSKHINVPRSYRMENIVHQIFHLSPPNVSKRYF
jgi:hypothetical protein